MLGGARGGLAAALSWPVPVVLPCVAPEVVRLRPVAMVAPPFVALVAELRFAADTVARMAAGRDTAARIMAAGGDTAPGPQLLA